VAILPKLKKLISGLLLIGLVFGVRVYASNYIDANQAQFNGTYTNTAWNTPNSGLTTSASNTTGTYASLAKGVGLASKYNTLSWTPNAPYWKEMPGGNAQETSYSTGNLNMNQNLGLWRLNETGSPTAWADNSTSNTALTCATTCPAPITNQIFNGGANFSTTNSQYLRATNTQSIRGLSQFSVSAWIRPSAITGTQSIWEEPTNSVTLSTRFSVRINASGNLVLAGRTADAAVTLTTFVTSSNTMVANNYYHVAAVFNADTDVHRVYINGVETSATVSASEFSTTLPNQVPRAGQGSTGTGSKYRGAMDELAVFGRSLSSTEVQNMFTRGALRVGFRLRSCNASNCSGVNFVGPDGTTGTTDYYSEINNSTTSLPSLTLNPAIVPNRGYIQYEITFSQPANLPAYTTTKAYIGQVNIDYQQTPSLTLALRNVSDTADQNTCALGMAAADQTKTCSYGLKIYSDSAAGYDIYITSSGNLSSGAHSMANAQSGRAGGTAINSSTVGTEAYGLRISTGSLTSGASINLESNFNAGANFVNSNLTSQKLLTANGPNLPDPTDPTRLVTATHALNISPTTIPGSYTQTVTYTVVPKY
jgi:Concanavalin A-like lectin/glucanases superfamily